MGTTALSCPVEPTAGHTQMELMDYPGYPAGVLRGKHTDSVTGIRCLGRCVLLAGCLSLACTGLLPGAARADEASDDMARGLFQAGAAAYAHGRYAEAMDLFQRAYTLSPRPQLLYNIGEAADHLRQDAVALSHFERYLEALPDAPNAPGVRARIEVLRRTTASMARAPGQPGVAESSAEVDTPEAMAVRGDADAASDGRWPKPLPLSLMIGGAALFGAAVVTGVMAGSAESKLDDACPGRSCGTAASADRAADLSGRIDTLAVTTDVLWVLGGVAAGTGALLWMRDSAERNDSAAAAAVAVRCGLARCTGTLRW